MKIFKTALFNLLTILALTNVLGVNIASAHNGSYVETNSSSDYHSNCWDHFAYVDGTDVLLRSGPGTSYSVVAVTTNRMHLYVNSLVGEYFAPFSGVMVKNTQSFKTKTPLNFYAGQKVNIQRHNLGVFSRYYIANVNGTLHALHLDAVNVTIDQTKWYEVVTENGQQGYIYGKYVKCLSESGNSSRTYFNYKYYQSHYNQC